MNIQQAKEQIKNAMKAYFAKDEFGEYCIPTERQRPIFLMGPPGVGKTAIMAQIVSELNVALLSYSMTHHTRQSALGLPFITQKQYGGREYSISEYTMSEIIASVYELIETTGKKEGILFLDEMNCVSETLMPVMLQFLQYKVFGRHRVPAGWLIVAAGNPPEYNDSVRDFDMAIWDRVRRVDVEPDYAVWRKYATASGVHPAILSYLNEKSDNLYCVSTTVDGKQFVTMRGWTDLSDTITLYEQQNLVVDEPLVGQFLQDREIAKDFAIYYDLFKKYRGEYDVSLILNGKAGDGIIKQAGEARFDERLAIVSLLIETIGARCKKIMQQDLALTHALGEVAALGNAMMYAKSVSDAVYDIIARKKQTIEREKQAGSLSRDQEAVMRNEIALYDRLHSLMLDKGCSDVKAGVQLTQKMFTEEKKRLSDDALQVGVALTNSFTFLENAFTSEREMLLYVTELTEHPYASQYIAKFGCEKYFAHNQDLMFYERQKQLVKKIDGN